MSDLPKQQHRADRRSSKELKTCNRKVHGPNLRHDTSYPERKPSWLSSVPKHKHQVSTSTRPRSIPPKLFPIHHSSTVLPLKACRSRLTTQTLPTTIISTLILLTNTSMEKTSNLHSTKPHSSKQRTAALLHSEVLASKS
jgi:hypothetical protein